MIRSQGALPDTHGAAGERIAANVAPASVLETSQIVIEIGEQEAGAAGITASNF
jgi:hypothetical protein